MLLPGRKTWQRYILEVIGMTTLPKKTMSVREMGKLLGLKKVESYWLVHKEYFETILVAGKMRVVIESFENWYARQVKYHKVTGEAPGELVKQESYSAGDIAVILGISEAFAYELMKAAGVKPILVNYWQRFPKEAFDQWYASQSRYRNADDRLRDAELEESSMSMPDMARLLDVPRSTVYSILKNDRGKEMLEVIVVADRKRITKESFERWYASQKKYLKPEDQPEGVPRRHKTYADSLVKKKVRTNKGTKEVRYSDNPDYLTVDEAALQAKTSTARVYKWINAGRFPVLRISKMVTRIPRKEFEAFLEENISRK
jgi:excisionase family DNA binding protein